MAGSAVIGALRVVLGADTAALEKGLKGAQADLASFGAGMARAGALVAAAMATMTAGVGLAVKSAVNEADNLGKMAQKIGIPVEELSALKHAADLSDVSMDSLSKSAGKLSKNMVEAVAKPTSEASNAFRSLGISVTNSDGSLKSSSAVMAEVAGKFEGIKDGAGKTALAMALFGRSGADLIPLLNSGKSGLTEMAAEAAQLGVVISTQTAKSAEAFNDNLTRLGKVKDGIIMQLTARMLPALETLSLKMINAAKESDVVNRVTGVLVKVFEGFARTVMLVADNMGVLLRVAGVFIGIQIASVALGAVGALVSLARAIQAAGLMMAAFNVVRAAGLKGILLLAGVVAIATGNFDTMVAKLGEVAAKVESALPEDMGQGVRNAIKALGFDLSALDADLTKFGQGGAASAKKGLTDVNVAAMGGKNALDQYIASIQKSVAAQQAELQTIGLAAGAKERLRVVLQGLQIAQAAGIPITEALRLKLTETAFAAEQMALKLQGAQLVQQNLAPGEAFRIEMENNRLALEAFGATADQVGRVQEATAQKYGATWQQAGTSIAGSFQQIGQAFAKENKAMATVAKAAGLAQAMISMWVGAAKALELPFPANMAAWAQVLATGASAIAGVKSVNVGGFATGGSFGVPGGMGGGDRVRAMVDLEPGERVDIWRPDQGGTDPRRGAQTERRIVELRADGAWRPFVEMLIPQLNAALRDGHELKLAAV